MKLSNTSAPEECFQQLSNWFQNRLTENEYPEGWKLENSFANCVPMPIYRFPVQYLASGEFPEDQLVQTGWNFIHEDLRGKEGCFLVTLDSDSGKDLYRFNQANYGRRSIDVKRILEKVQSADFKPEYQMEFRAALLAGGPKYFYDVWLRSSDGQVNIFIDLPPNLYDIDKEKGITVDVKDFKGFHGKLTNRIKRDQEESLTESIREEMKSGL